MKTLTLACALCLTGCLGEATFNSNDLSASVFDLSTAQGDQGGGGDGDAGGGDGGKLSNCVQLNDCEKACAADPKPLMCIAACRAMASPAAVTKEMALQSCFGQYCPQATDAGTGAVCTQTDMGFTPTCRECIADSQVMPGNACVGSTPAACHQCYTQAAACVADQ